MSQPVRRTGADKPVIDHIDADGVIAFADSAAPSDANAEWLNGCNGKGLNTDDFSQAPMIDADRSAEWNRKAKTVKAGNFAARRMADEE